MDAAEYAATIGYSHGAQNQKKERSTEKVERHANELRRPVGNDWSVKNSIGMRLISFIGLKMEKKFRVR